MSPSVPVSRSGSSPTNLGRRGLGLTKVGWVPEGDVDYSDWIETGRYFGALGRGSQWWIGDWLLYARGKWGEMYTQAVKITGYDYGSLRNMTSVAQEFVLSRRRDKLSWGHHAAVAGLAPEQQDHWLDQAITLKWSRDDLRTELRTSRRVLSTVASDTHEPVQSGEQARSMLCPHCGGTIPLDPDVPECTTVVAA